MRYGTGSNCLGMEAMGIDVSLPRKSLQCKAKDFFLGNTRYKGCGERDGIREKEREPLEIPGKSRWGESL